LISAKRVTGFGRREPDAAAEQSRCQRPGEFGFQLRHDGGGRLLAFQNGQVPAFEIGAADRRRLRPNHQVSIRQLVAADGMAHDGVGLQQHSRVPMGLSRQFTLEMSTAMTVIPPGIFQLVTEKYSPVTFMWDGKPSGFVTDMVREIAARQKIPYNIRLTSWNNAYNIALPHPKVVLFSAERTPEREKLFHWVGAYREEQRHALREERP